MYLQFYDELIPGTKLNRSEMDGLTGLAFLKKVFFVSEGVMLTQIRDISGIDSSTLQNWTKRGWVANSHLKRYDMDQVAHILIINMLRSCMRLDRIAYLIRYVNGDVALYMQTYFPNVPIPSYLYPVALPTTVVTLVAVVCWLLRVLLQGGWVLYHLGVRRGEEMPYATLFDGFGFIGKLILLNIVITLYVFLWSMLFIIPGIIASYRYRFAVYNLCENPDMGVMEAISMSKAQTAGYKGDLFLLDLTFIGWNLLCSLTLGILSIWIAPYIIQTNIGYFQEIKRIKGIGWQARPEQPDDTFHPTDPFGPEL